MSLIEGLLIFFTIITLYAIIVVILYKKGILKKFNISFWGPALMWRTDKGKKFLQKLATKRRFWKAFANTGIVVCFITMILMTIMVIFSAWASLGFTAEQKEQLPGPEYILAIPGINPMIPLEFVGYFILALVIAMVVHEFSHGILTYVSKFKVKSLGILYLIAPIGAFCEPDEEQLKNAKNKPRMRIYAAGPMANFVVVLISLLLCSFLFISSVQPAADEGVGVFYVLDEAPADEIGLAPGMIITSINDTQIATYSDFYYIMGNTTAGQTVNITYVQSDRSYAKQVTLDNQYDYIYPKNESFNGTGYLGVGPNVFIDFLPILKNPLSDFPTGFMFYWILPLIGVMEGFNPIVAPFTDSYIITGPLSIIPDNIFWIIINALYWIFWLNFAVAIFNVLPMVPLDGGFLFNDAMNSLVRRIKKGLSKEQREAIVKNITLGISLTILILIILPFIIKFIP